MPKANPPREPWDGETNSSPIRQKARKERRAKKDIDAIKVIDSNNLVNRAGELCLSGDGMRQLKLMRKFYGGESASYVIDRLLRRALLRRMVIALVMDPEDYNLWDEEAKARGYPDAESLIEESIDMSSKKLRERSRI